MPLLLMWVGIFLILLGVSMIVPVLQSAEGITPLLVLGAPIAMNGIWLIIAGLLFLAILKIVLLLEKIAGTGTGKIR